MAIQIWPHRAGRAILMAGSVLLSGTFFPALAQSDNGLATRDELATETTAIELIQSADVIKAEHDVAALFKAKDGLASLQEQRVIANAAHELAFAAALAAANSDPTHPKIVWTGGAPRTWHGHAVPGSRWGIDNPDNVYRFVPVDSSSKYVIKVKPSKPGPVQFSFLIYDSIFGENGDIKGLDQPVAGLRDVDIKRSADGSFSITVDNAPANGRANHLQTSVKAKLLLIRNTFSDWGSQKPFAVEISRVGGPEPKPVADKKALAALTASYLNAGARTVLAWREGVNQLSKKENALTTPHVRGGGWGFASSGRFKLAADEALVVTLHPRGAKYLSVDLTDLWLVSREHIASSGNLNNTQAEAGKDGSYTYVISAKDPGVRNWLDTGGLTEGNFTVRWQVFPPDVTQIDDAVKQIKRVKLTDLAKYQPSDATKLTPAQRSAENKARAASYANRYR